MKKYTAIITDGDIRFGIETTIRELEEDQIQFPDANARAEFIDECVSSILDKYELYDRDPFTYRPDFTGEVLDMAGLYGYQL